MSHEMGMGENRTKGEQYHERKIGMNVGHQNDVTLGTRGGVPDWNTANTS